MASNTGSVAWLKCSHCQLTIDRCCLLPEKLPNSFRLLCSACDKEFKVLKSQKSMLTTGGRKYFRKEAVKSLDQIGVCDLIQYEVSIMGMKKDNFAICTRIDREAKKIHVVKLTLNDEDIKVVEKEVREEVLIKKATVYRFMPLDCSSKDVTLSRAKESVEKGTEDWLKTKIGESLSFEKFANWLKTGEAKDLILRVRDVINECPTCNEPLYQSYLLSREPLQLFCTVCRGRYEVRGSEEQLAKLRNGYGKPCKTEDLTSIDQLRPGDVFKRDIKGAPAGTHHMICEHVDRQTNIIHVIELSTAGKSGIKVKIQRNQFSLGSIKNAHPKVDRYLPLDCLPLLETLKLAREYADGKRQWKPEKYNVASNNCQHFASFCKVGKRISEDVDALRDVPVSGKALVSAGGSASKITSGASHSSAAATYSTRTAGASVGKKVFAGTVGATIGSLSVVGVATAGGVTAGTPVLVSVSVGFGGFVFGSVTTVVTAAVAGPVVIASCAVAGAVIGIQALNDS